MALTKIGQRTHDEFVKKFGAKDGHKKFTDAMDRGILDRSTHENLLVAGAGDGDSGAGPPPNSQGAALHQAAALGNLAGIDGPIPTTPPNPTKPGKRRVPTGIARAAGGSFQTRPG